ncbi:MAG TPA: Smr/MutS family protein [Aestuariivirgaceae bacterium]
MTKKTAHGAQVVPDMELWENVMRAVKPLRARSLRAEEPKSSDPVKSKSRHSPSPAARHSSPMPKEPPLLTGLDRRLSRRLTRGQLEYDAKLDLHGARTAEARGRLLGFLQSSRSRGHRILLVVTGKGASPFARHTLHGDSHFHAPERQGRLRRLVSEWLHEPEFRQHISGFQPAHPRHGGGGAFYLRLRRGTSARP